MASSLSRTNAATAGADCGSVIVKILVNGKVVSQGTATGGYNIAMAEISQDPLTGGWADTNQG